MYLGRARDRRGRRAQYQRTASLLRGLLQLEGQGVAVARLAGVVGARAVLLLARTVALGRRVPRLAAAVARLLVCPPDSLDQVYVR